MLSALSSYIWGTEEDTETKTEQLNIENQIELENDWIFVRPSKEHADLKRRYVNFNDDSASTASESSAANGMEESWLVTPPQCFNSKRRRNKNAKTSPMENLLIEHPSMSIYQDKEDGAEEEAEEQVQQVEVRQGETHRAVAGRLQELEKRQPLKDLNAKSQKSGSPKSLKRKNMVYVRSHSTRKNKQYGRMSGKHTGMVGKRGS